MIELHFHWAWLLIAVIIVAGMRIAYPFYKERNEGIGGAYSWLIAVFVVTITILLALVVAGIFIW